jgi:hypothetical protein
MELRWTTERDDSLSTAQVMGLRTNNTLERTVNRRGRIVLAMDPVLADAQRQRWSAAQLGR